MPYKMEFRIILVDSQVIVREITFDNKTQIFAKLKEIGTEGYIDYDKNMYYPPCQIRRIAFEYL